MEEGHPEGLLVGGGGEESPEAEVELGDHLACGGLWTTDVANGPFHLLSRPTVHVDTPLVPGPVKRREDLLMAVEEPLAGTSPVRSGPVVGVAQRHLHVAEIPLHGSTYPDVRLVGRECTSSVPSGRAEMATEARAAEPVPDPRVTAWPSWHRHPGGSPLPAAGCLMPLCCPGGPPASVMSRGFVLSDALRSGLELELPSSTPIPGRSDGPAGRDARQGDAGAGPSRRGRLSLSPASALAAPPSAPPASTPAAPSTRQPSAATSSAGRRTDSARSACSTSNEPFSPTSRTHQRSWLRT